MTMYNADTELLFPSRVIPGLQHLRTPQWDQLLAQVSDQGSESPEQMAFVLMMVRQGGCLSCNADSFRAMRGCTQCARQTVRRYKGSDQDLEALFQTTLKEVNAFLQKC